MNTRSLVAVLALVALSAQAQEIPLRVGVKHAPPFVILDGDTEPRGLSIDLIRAVAERMDPPRRVEFVAQDTLKAHLDAVRQGEVQLGIAATTVTAERSESLEFSPPFYSGGLGIVVRDHGELSLWELVFTRATAKIVLGVALYVLFCAVLIWLLARGETFARSAKQGIPEAIWWTLVTMSTVGYGDFAPRRPLARALAAMIILSGIALFGALVAEVTSLITLAELRPAIQGEDDLSGRQVGVLRDTFAADAFREREVRLVEFGSLEEALTGVREGKVEALIHDRPLLRARLLEGAPELTLTGGAFHIQDYAIAFQLESELRRPVSQALLRLREEAHQRTYRALIVRWLGD